MSTRAIASRVGTRATSSRAVRGRRAVDSGRPPPVLRKFAKWASTARVTATTATTDDADDSETFDDAIVSESVDENADEGSWDEDEDEDEPEPELVPYIGGELLKADPPGHKSGYVAIVGRPNAGKSTLMNDLVGTKLSIVTFKPQTTRHRILGIVSEDAYQMVLLDTPGVMVEEFNKLDGIMLKSVRNSMANADVMFYIVDAARDPYGAWEGLAPKKGKRVPTALILNKCDLVGDRERIMELIDYFRAQDGIDDVLPISALNSTGVENVKNWALDRLPLGPTLYPKEAISEHPERFFIAEIIREKIFLQYKQEVPYSTQVWIEAHKERDGAKKDLILAKVYVERQSQIGIIVGQGGAAMKKLSSTAREDIEKFLGRPVFLDIQVKVRDGWRQDEASLEDLGLDDPNRLEQPSI
ncbi:P-loop containing nucleoside triphosphate hydrolase [Ostreococcus tauri]|uniref:GTP-binding protein-like protein n=1 Tax=Ostreococcus tauri TaxID=70448 RepID=Q00WD2_OSTTA|nr:P-loop containing nucleoside triphosphate hydrolase [Ostreococcus tauri]OUS45846.1 GTP-binding protein-like protein [Ostreococcus tauri]CAL56826.1 P-loop containing nucleoside triphosphate hydrolase [Ostreococcus tauri]|eukprot:XP_003082871.1 P-loop containing nucleoside triphosphate hydrolase [Ostreococcus tauri]